jgi:hypothetical protein
MRSTTLTGNLKRLVVCSVLAAWPALAADTAGPWQVVRINEVTWVGLVKEGDEFEVHIETKKPKDAHGPYFGSVDQPDSAVTEIIVKVDGDKIRFPKPAVEDLANPLLQTLSVTSQPTGEVKVRFLGGNGAATYEVEFFLETGKLTKRTVKYFEAKDGKKQEVIKDMTF